MVGIAVVAHAAQRRPYEFLAASSFCRIQSVFVCHTDTRTGCALILLSALIHLIPMPLASTWSCNGEIIRAASTAPIEVLPLLPWRSRIGLEKSHRFQEVAIGIADESGVVTVAVLRSQSRRAIARAASGERRGMERVDQFDRAHAQPHMRTAIAGDGRHGGSQVDPKLRVSLAEADGRRAGLELRVADRAQHDLVEARCLVEIANANGDVVDHRRLTPARPSAPACIRWNPSAPGTRHR